MYIYNQTFIEESKNTCSVCANKDCSLDVTVAHRLVKIHLSEQPFHPRYQQLKCRNQGGTALERVPSP